MRASLILRCLAVLFLTAAALPAAVPKPISKVPFEIKLPGRYVLTQNLTLKDPAALSAILVSANDVVLDLQGWTLTCADGLATTKDVAGVRATGRNYVTVRNGTLRGFNRGVFFDGAPNNVGGVVEDIVADRCVFVGIQINSSDSTARRNRVTAVGGTNSPNRYGMYFRGTGLRVIDNDVNDVPPFSEATKSYGIYFYFSGACVVQGNRLVTPVLTFLPNHISTGIYLENNGSDLLAGNYIMGFQDGINFFNSVSNVYRDNTALTSSNTRYLNTANNIDGGGNN